MNTVKNDDTKTSDILMIIGICATLFGSLLIVEEKSKDTTQKKLLW